MGRSRKRLWLGAAAVLIAVAVAAILAGPGLVRSYWSARSTNPVRRGVERMRQLGCFTCHGFQGVQGIPDPGIEEGEVPAWSGMVWMMYVEDADEVREFILDGISQKRAASFSALAEIEGAAIAMPAYRDVLEGTDLEDMTAAFLVLSGMSRPARSKPEGRGYRLARKWDCFACHGVAGSGGVENPGSFAGFIPGWYGPDFEDLVRDRAEFDAWIRDGGIERLTSHPIASKFIESQRIQMPPYPNFTDEELDDLWAYARWLASTGGGVPDLDEGGG